MNYANAKFYKEGFARLAKDALTQDFVQSQGALSSMQMVTSRPKVLFKYTQKEKRHVEQGHLTSVEDVMQSLVTDYTLPLRKIDQSVPRGTLIIHKVFGNKQKRTVLKEETLNSVKSCLNSKAH